ncbi:helix-turn-helix domain-containing protein [Acinetobacter radioresistens]|nr:helix-turn-helix domain-containing protein [Acinetobacter radioresistens]
MSTDPNITEIAYKWGATHLGCFSIEYKEVFGEKPSETLKKIIER